MRYVSQNYTRASLVYQQDARFISGRARSITGDWYHGGFGTSAGPLRSNRSRFRKGPWAFDSPTLLHKKTHPRYPECGRLGRGRGKRLSQAEKFYHMETMADGLPHCLESSSLKGSRVRFAPSPPNFLEVLGTGKPTSLEAKGRRKLACRFDSCRLRQEEYG